MSDPLVPDTSKIVSLFLSELPADLTTGVSALELSSCVDGFLYGDRQLWRLATETLITRTEAAEALAAHVESWLVSRQGRSFRERGPSWTPPSLINTLEHLLFFS
jgi:hypothetical protein